MSQQNQNDTALTVSTEESIPEMAELFNVIMENPQRMFEVFRIDMRQACQHAIERMIEMELSEHLGRKPYERTDGEVNYRNGSYPRRFTAKGIGTLNFNVPRDRNGTFQSKVIKRYQRYDDDIAHDMQAIFLSGMSTRNIALFSERLLGRKVSASEVSNVNKELLVAIDAWRTRPLSDVHIEYMIMDGVFFKIRTKNSVKRIPMLVVIGVTKTKERIFLALQQGDKDAASTWREVFKDMKARGLTAANVKLGIMDGLAGLEKVFAEEFTNAKIQRCTVHVTRNVLAKTTKDFRGEVSDRLRDIFYAADKKTALGRFNEFEREYEKHIPSAVSCLKRSINACLTFYSFPEEEWISLRTTNMIERVNKEFKRRTKPMEILGGEKSAYLILCFVAYKQEQNWKRAPFGKSNLPILKKFTQKT